MAPIADQNLLTQLVVDHISLSPNLSDYVIWMRAKIVMICLIGRYGLLLVLFIGCPLDAVAQDQQLFVEAVDYTKFEPIDGCTRDREEAIYKGCLRPRELYDAALTTARGMKRPLMIVWGFDECPGCQSFEARYFGAQPKFCLLYTSPSPRDRG